MNEKLGKLNKGKVLLIIALILSVIFNIVMIYTYQELASWKEGDGYISIVYTYNLPFWRVFFPSVAHNPIFQGDYYISRTLGEAVNLTDGWWHVVSIGTTIIHIEKVKAE